MRLFDSNGFDGKELVSRHKSCNHGAAVREICEVYLGGCSVEGLGQELVAENIKDLYGLGALCSGLYKEGSSAHLHMGARCRLGNLYESVASGAARSLAPHPLTLAADNDVGSLGCFLYIALVLLPEWSAFVGGGVVASFVGGKAPAVSNLDF